MRSRFQLNTAVINVLAIKVRIIDNAFVEAVHKDDDSFLQMAHFLMTNPGMPEVVRMFGDSWVMLMYPSAETT